MSTAIEQVELQDRILEALRDLSDCCHPPLGETLWPSWGELKELDSAVVSLAMVGRKKTITALTPYWKAYECVDKKQPEIRLLPRIKELVGRADKLLKKAGESDLVRLRRKTSPESIRLANDLETIQEDARKAGKIEWEDYEGLLGDGKPFRLPYGDSAPRGVRCYVRALLLIVDHLRHLPLRREALPLLTWIAGIGSPYGEMLTHDYQAKYCADYMTRRRADKITERKREQSRLRKRRQRLKKLKAFLRAEGTSEGEVQKILASNA